MPPAPSVTCPQSAADMAEKGKNLSELSGIGKDLAGKITEIMETGGLGQIKELQSRTPADLGAMMDIPGLGQPLRPGLSLQKLKRPLLRGVGHHRGAGPQALRHYLPLRRLYRHSWAPGVGADHPIFFPGDGG